MNRRGFSLTESVLALAVVSAATVLLAQILFAAANQQRVHEQRRVALAEVANRLEQASIVPWTELSKERLEPSSLSPAAQAVLPGAKLTATVSDESGELRSRRIRIELSWTNAAGERLPPVTLACWRFPDEVAR
ncbi:MAG TPA: type II secretion system protein [Pirellulaceae bacterium]|nr:type II secretion system protein [Pirellulaceae bacterium]